MSKIIDVHTHIFPDKIAKKASESIGDFYGIPMENDGTVENLIMQMKKSNIYKSVVNSCATIKEQVVPINRFIHDSISNHEELIGLITLHHDLNNNQIEDEINFAHENNFVGIKLHPDFQKIDIDDERLHPIYKAADEAKLPILIHTGDPTRDFSHPLKLLAVAKIFPKLKFLAAHFGGYTKWEFVKEYAQTPNVYIDTSSSLEFLDVENATDIISALGVDHVLFGTDYPMWDAKDEIAKIKRLGYNEKELEDIFYYNSLNFFAIK